VPDLLDEIIFVVVKTLPNWTKHHENNLKLLLSWDEKLVLLDNTQEGAQSLNTT
jgi:hypothetical protein